MERYDEDLSENSFFQVLQKDHREVFERAVEAGWIVCVPRAGALPKYALAQDDILGHILVPSEELPETHFRTLTERNVVLNGNVLVLENSVSNPLSVHILFDETFYDDNMRKYKVMCLEDPLYTSQAFGLKGGTGLVTISSLRDCVDLLWTEAGGEKVFERFDSLILQFLSNNPHLEEETLQSLRDLGSALFSEAIQAALADPRLRQKTEKDQYLLDAVKLAVETYVLHGIYKDLMKGIAACKADDDAKLNRAIKNLSDLQVRDLDIDPQLSGNLTKAKFELANIEAYRTPLGKLCCLKRAIALVTVSGNVLSIDELLPVLLFLVIKANLPNWCAHLSFLKFFRFSAGSSNSGEQSYNISSLEAAIEHIFSGSLLGSTSPEADCILEPGCTPCPMLKSMEEVLNYSGVDPVARYFECIRLGRADDVRDILDGKYNPFPQDSDSESVLVEAEAHLCHPLCSCDRCEKLVTKPKKDVMPTVQTREERGYTGLHVACIFGRPTVVDLLISLGSDLNATDFLGATPLHYAAQRGHQNALLLLLHAGADINKCDGDTNSPLHLCSLNGHVACVKALLFYAESIGCEIAINGQNNVLDTPLHLASRWGYSTIVELLLERILNLGLDLKVYNNRKLTAFDCAHNHHIARMIVNAKVRKDEEQQRLIRIGIASQHPSHSVDQKSVDVTKFVEGSFVNQRVSVQQDTSHMKHIEKLLKAVKVGDIKLSCFYLGIEEKICSEDDNAVVPPPKVLCHPLCQCPKCATQVHQIQELSALSFLGINACNGDGFTALHVAVTHNHIHLTKVLLYQGANPNLKTRGMNLTPLHIAAQNGNLEIMESLMSHGVEINAQDTCGNTALHHCCAKGCDQGVQLLMDWKASKDITNLSDNSPAQEAEKQGHWHIVEMLFGKLKPN